MGSYGDAFIPSSLPLRFAQELPPDLCDESSGGECQVSFLQRKAQREEVEEEVETGRSLEEMVTFDDSKQVPMVAYPKKYCQHCGEMAFCHRASNPGCGGRATGGVVSFQNHAHAKGCHIEPTLTVPRSYMRVFHVLLCSFLFDCWVVTVVVVGVQRPGGGPPKVFLN